MKRPALLAFALLLTLQPALAQTVGLVGTMGQQALLIVDGSPPKSVVTGSSFKGVKVLSVRAETSVVEIGGKQLTLRVGDAPAHVGGAATAGNGEGSNRVVLQAGSGGHFVTQGQINGKSVQLVVDTGASLVAIASTDADRLGIDYKSGQPSRLTTANGVINAWRVKLASVQVGDVRIYDVDSVVSEGSMPFVLLGNSFLSRFQMTRNNDQMVLEKRY